MRILLDENIPLLLHKHLTDARLGVDHIITLDRRGMADGEIRARLRGEEILFLTQDEEFLDWDELPQGTVVLSRVLQSRPLHERVAIWAHALEKVLRLPRETRLFELDDSGALLPWTKL